MQGRIINLRENYGFLRADNEKFDRFFHAGAVSPLSQPFEDFERHDRVRFEPIDDGGKHRATGVYLLAKDNLDVQPPFEDEEHF